MNVGASDGNNQAVEGELNAAKSQRVVVTGAGGFIGGHLVKELIRSGYQNVSAVDTKPIDAWEQRVDGAEVSVLDLSRLEACLAALDGAAQVYNFAADMGGMGFIEHHKAACMLSVLINTHLLMAAREHGVERFFFASSACVYPIGKQDRPDLSEGLRESAAYPAMPEDGYGWEKLFSERMCRHYREDFGLETRVARFHNIYGPEGTWRGGREKAPAALCRKVALAKLQGTGEIEIWGDGEQTRSFTYISDAIDGTLRLMNSDVSEPLNIGSDELISIGDLVSLIEEIAEVKLDRRHVLDAPLGVRGRNSQNDLVRERLGWAPSVTIRAGIEQTYRWVEEEVRRAYS